MASLENINPEKAVYDALAADADVTDGLAEFESLPAIFFAKQVPSEAERPYIWMPGRASSRSVTTKQASGENILFDLWIVDDGDESNALVDSLARAVKACLHRQELPLTGGRQMKSIVTGPVPAPLEEGLVGVVLTLEYEFYEN